jgi:hypothetical protein
MYSDKLYKLYFVYCYTLNTVIHCFTLGNHWSLARSVHLESKTVTDRNYVMTKN